VYQTAGSGKVQVRMRGIAIPIGAVLVVASTGLALTLRASAAQQTPIEVLAEAILHRALQLDDGAELADCGLTTKLGVDSARVWSVLSESRIRTRLVPCRSVPPFSGTLVVEEVTATRERSLVRIRAYLTSGGRRMEDITTDVTRTIGLRQEIRLWGYSPH
jgi:hypothetical protein